MSKAIEVGDVYKLIDASLCPMLTSALADGYMTFPDDGVIAVSAVTERRNGDTAGHSLTEGFISKDKSWGAKGAVAIAQSSLDLGAFELITMVE